MVQVILWLLVLVWTTEAKVSKHNKLHPDGILQINQEATTTGPDLSDLLPEVVAPQVPIFLREGFDSTPNRQSERQQTRLFKYGDIEALLVEGFIIPIVHPVGNLTDLPLPPEGQEPALPLVDQADQEILQDSRNDVMRMAVSSGNDPLMCGNYEIRSDVGVTLQTPYYPDKYTGNFKCRWILTVVDSDAMLINCPDFQLAKGDVLSTTLVGQPDTLTKYVYKNGPVNQILEGNTVRVVFTSNRYRHQRGFLCTVNALGSTTTTTSTTSTTPTTTTTTSTTPTTTTTTTAKPPTTTATTTSTKPTTTTTTTPTTTTTTTKPTTTTTTTPTTTTTTTKPTTTTSTSTTTTVSTTTLPPLSDPDCGIANRNRIVNGQSATANEYPWQSFLEMKWSDGKNQLCGGSLITKQWILTAGHCVLRKDGSGNLWKPEVKVTLGMHTRTSPLANGGIQYTAVAVEIHPQNNFAYDLALIKLPQEVVYKREVRPVCLPNRDSLSRNVTSVLMALVGWGKTETGKLTDELRELSRYGIESAICQKVFGSYITAHHFCTSGIEEKHICLGDSGGPVMTVDRGRFTLTGVVSFVATADCKGEYPDGHISVVHFLDWIQEMTKQVLY